jgi:hypothetical protein
LTRPPGSANRVRGQSGATLPENPAPTFDVSPLDEKNDQQAADIVCERMQIGHREAARCDAAMTVSELIIKRAPLGPNLEDYSVLEHGAVVGRIFLSPAAPVLPENHIRAYQ